MRAYQKFVCWLVMLHGDQQIRQNPQHDPIQSVPTFISQIAGRGQGSRSRVGKLCMYVGTCEWIICGSPKVESTVAGSSPVALREEKKKKKILKKSR